MKLTVIRLRGPSRKQSVERVSRETSMVSSKTSASYMCTVAAILLRDLILGAHYTVKL